MQALPASPDGESASKQQIMEGLAADLQRNEFTFPDGWLTGELEAFEYTYSASGVKYTAPEGLHDDGVCALALARECRRRNVMNRIRLVSAQPVIVN